MIVPAPRSLRATGGTLAVDAATAIDTVLDPSLGAGAYRLSVTGDGIRIAAGDDDGAFWARQALRQLAPTEHLVLDALAPVHGEVPCVEIDDAPRFGWRGLMLDVSRHFLPKADVLRLIDLLALHRMSSLHLHLTDDQGWRIEILEYPRLTEVGAWRAESQAGAGPEARGDGVPHGGFYTQDDIREIVAYASARRIRVVPEIDMPGHMRAAIAAYPELGVTGAQLEVMTTWGISDDVLNVEESTVRWACDVLDEVMALFPGEYIGVGGDECPKTQWEADPRTQQLMRERGLADEEQLQSWFIGRLDEHLTAAGRRLFGWDEILEGGLAPGATVASWRGLIGAVAAARSGHDVVSCPDDQVYLDYRQSELPNEPIPVAIPLTLRDVFDFDPVPPGLTEAEAAHILGGQGNVWTEHMDGRDRVDYQTFPRACALAEALWLGEGRDWADFERRMAAHSARLDALGVDYRPADGPRPDQERPGIPGRPSTRAERQAYIDSVTANIAAG